MHDVRERSVRRELRRIPKKVLAKKDAEKAPFRTGKSNWTFNCGQPVEASSIHYGPLPSLARNGALVIDTAH